MFSYVLAEWLFFSCTRGRAADVLTAALGNGRMREKR